MSVIEGYLMPNIATADPILRDQAQAFLAPDLTPDLQIPTPPKPQELRSDFIVWCGRGRAGTFPMLLESNNRSPSI